MAFQPSCEINILSSGIFLSKSTTRTYQYPSPGNPWEAVLQE